MQIPWNTKRCSTEWFLEQIKPGISLEVKMVKLRLLYSGQIMRRQNSLQKTMVPGMAEGNGNRGRPKTGWIDSVINEAIGFSLQ